MHSTLDQSEGRSEAGASRVERGSAIALAVIAFLTLLAWKLSPTLAALPPGWGLMHPTTALCMLLVAVAIECSGTVAPAWRTYVMQACSGLVVLLALLTLIAASRDGHMPLDDWWVAGGSAMSPQSAAGLLLFGLALPLTRIYRGPFSIAVDVLAVLLVDFMLVMLMGYVFSLNSLFGEAGGIRIPPPSFLCFLICTAFLIQRRGHGGMLAVLRGDRIGSRIVRVAIPLALALPLALSLVRAYVVSTGLLSAAYASAASISFICLCVTLLSLLMGWRINGLERDVRDLMQKHSDAQLQESEQRYMDLVEQSISGFVVRRADGRLILVNEAYRKMTGYSREELLQLSAKDLVVDQGVLERVRRLEPGQSTHIETFLKRKDGNLLEVEYVTQRTRDGNLQSVLLDISHRKQLQKQRDESERRYAELVEQAQEGISVRRPNGSFVFVNETFCRMLGYSREELLGLTIQDIVHPDDVETLNQIQQMGHGGHLRLKKRMRRKDGSVIYVEVSAKRLRNGDIQSTVQDVTERHAAEHRYETAVNALAEGVAVLDREGRVIAFNKSAIKILAMTQDQFTGRMVQDPDWKLQREDGTPFPLEEHPVMITLSTGEGRDDVILVAALPDGSRRVLTVSSRGLEPDKDGKPTSVLASFRDITQQRQHEQKLREMSRRLGEAQETERRAIARELHDEVGQSLTATRINLRDLGQQATDPPLQQRLADTEEIIAELLGKVRQMSLDLHPSVLDDLGLVPALRWCVRTRTTGSPMQVRMDLPEDLPRFSDMVEITLFRVFQEALSNALKHAQAPHLDVSLRYREGHLDLSLKDDGKGFDAEAARRAALSGKSLGVLGMQERVRLAGGEFIMDSAPGRGAEIRVSLPAEER